MREIKILSLFDGMACGAIAFTELGIPIDRYVAFEYDEETANAKKGRPFGYAALVASCNFPFIEQRGNVFEGDFTEFSDFDWLIGGSPCTYWSIAQKNNRETEASGLGWELFSQYVRAVHEAKPKCFLYENNKSMSKEIRASIDKAFGFEAIGINSALVSAQNRQRLYWVGVRQADGTYRKADIEQPEDRGILLRDVLDNAVAWQDKGYALTTRCNGAIPEDTLTKHRHTMCAEPIEQGNARYLLKNLKYADEKTGTLTACCYKGIGADGMYTVAEPVNVTADGKAQTLRATCYKDGIRNMVGNNIDRKTCVAEPICVAQRGRYAESGEIIQHYEPREDGKTNAITTVQKDNAIAEPVRIGCYPSPDGTLKNSQGMRLYDINAKSVNLTAQGGGIGTKTGLYAIPADGKTYPVYEVCNGLITIKDKQYPIKLADGYYIIRKLTVSECMRLQTVPEWYDFSVISNSQAYKCLGNGWTVEVIAHLITAAIKNAPVKVEFDRGQMKEN